MIMPNFVLIHSTVFRHLCRIKWNLHIIPWNHNTFKDLWKCVSRIFIVFLDFNASDPTLMTWCKSVLYIGQILLNLNLEGIGNWNIRLDSLSPWVTEIEIKKLLVFVFVLFCFFHFFSRFRITLMLL